MDKYSISFTLGKASDPHGANIAHNNRQFTAPNVQESRSGQNITYVQQDVRDAYQQLFAQAIKEYNNRQYRRDRVIPDYYDHIANGRREEPYYEVVVQFGDMHISPCGSDKGEIVTQMLDEYMRDFQARNPNLYVFNATLHLDEASPHLHIDFIPFYTQGRINGLSTGVSMKAALDEMGFRAKGQRQNRLVAWEERERTEMESILHRHGYVREDKGAHYAHMTVEEYKIAQDNEKLQQALRRLQNVSAADTAEESIRRLRVDLQAEKTKNAALERERHSPYKAFFYASQEKQAWILQKLEELDIPYHETDNGFEAQECYVQTIRRLEKEYKAPRSVLRDKLREDIDRLLMQSRSLDELLEKLRDIGYTVKSGKYLSVRPAGSSSYIRLKSLGEYYSEFALKNRITAKKRYEQALARKIAEASRTNAPTWIVLRTVQLYTIAFSQNALPVRRSDPGKPFAWTNDAELDRLLMLNRRISEGATMETLRQDFAEKEKVAADKADRLHFEQEQLRRVYEIKEQLEVLFAGKKSDIFSFQQAESVLKEFPTINAHNWQDVDKAIEKQESAVGAASVEFETAQRELHDAAELVATMERIVNGSYIQSLVAAENDRRDSEFMPNGIRPGGGAI